MNTVASMTAEEKELAAEEPLPSGHPLWSLPNVRVTPHVAGLSSVPDIAEQFGANLARYMAGSPLAHVVDRTRGY